MKQWKIWEPIIYKLLYSLPLWSNKSDPKKSVSRSTDWRIVKTAQERAGIEGPQATAKGLRHGTACAMIMGGIDLYTLQYIY